MLATNTSVMSVAEIGARARARRRIIGTHWWNPPFLIPLVEVVQAPDTDPEVVARTLAFLTALGKTPVHVKRDVPGFVGNRLQHALWREAFDLIDQGVCDPATVDTVVKSGSGCVCRSWARWRTRTSSASTSRWTSTTTSCRAWTLRQSRRPNCATG